MGIPIEGLLLENLSAMGSPLLKDIAKGLHEGQNALVFDHHGENLPQLTIEQLMALFVVKYI